MRDRMRRLSQSLPRQLDGVHDSLTREYGGRVASGASSGKMLGFLRHPVAAGIRERIVPLRLTAHVLQGPREEMVLLRVTQSKSR